MNRHGVEVFEVITLYSVHFRLRDLEAARQLQRALESLTLVLVAGSDIPAKIRGCGDVDHLVFDVTGRLRTPRQESRNRSLSRRALDIILEHQDLHDHAAPSNLRSSRTISSALPDWPLAFSRQICWICSDVARPLYRSCSNR